jgi:hypothetical protein
MLNVFFTVDVEIWCDGWNDLDRKFPEAFQRYVYGPTPQGNYGLPATLDLLQAHGLKGVFFVEPLFSTRFGQQPLADIIGILRDASQDIELHLHTEWVDESVKPLLTEIKNKRQHLRYFSLAEQRILIEAGQRLLLQAGSDSIHAFRAGSFGFNRNTLVALKENNIFLDSSYNASAFGLNSGVCPGITVVDALDCEGVTEYPMTVFNDGTRTLRHAQLTACSYNELESLLWQALESGRQSFVILSHNFELLNEAKTRPDTIVVDRFRKLCALLDRNRDSFRTCGFKGLPPRLVQAQPSPLVSPLWKTGQRMLEQAYRRRYQ